MKFLSQSNRFPFFTFLSEGDEVFITIQYFPLFTWGSESFTLEMKFLSQVIRFSPFHLIIWGKWKFYHKPFVLRFLPFYLGKWKFYFGDEILITVPSFFPSYLFIWGREHYITLLPNVYPLLRFSIFTFLSGGGNIISHSSPMCTLFFVFPFLPFYLGKGTLYHTPPQCVPSSSFFPFYLFIWGRERYITLLPNVYPLLRFSLFTFLSEEVKVLLWRWNFYHNPFVFLFLPFYLGEWKFYPLPAQCVPSSSF